MKDFPHKDKMELDALKELMEMVSGMLGDDEQMTPKAVEVSIGESPEDLDLDADKLDHEADVLGDDAHDESMEDFDGDYEDDAEATPLSEDEMEKLLKFLK